MVTLTQACAKYYHCTYHTESNFLRTLHNDLEFRANRYLFVIIIRKSILLFVDNLQVKFDVSMFPWLYFNLSIVSLLFFLNTLPIFKEIALFMRSFE